ncbi:MAG TPA: DUF1622 domain-containing protein [Sphingomonas sp.]|jgi:uncharacterized membrane protein|uniref:DUF1622 domain-containing protein n=1 Tax=Sphingomonas sp. TaxID=28214 RepID=UPI002ED8E1EF
MDFLKQITLWLASATETAAALIIALAILEATLRALRLFLHRSVREPDHDDRGSHDVKEEIRLKLGRWLALSLEFALAADILRTAVAPSWDEIAKLAAIAVLRTALNFFLQREIDGAQARQGRLNGTTTYKTRADR